MTDEARKQVKMNIEALVAFEPRKQTLKMLADGRIEVYLDWAMGDGHV